MPNHDPQAAHRPLAIPRQFGLFAFVGAVATAVQYITLWAGVELGSLAPAVASTAGFMVGSLASYALNSSLTFRSTAPRLRTAARFYAIAASGLLINYLLMTVLTVTAALNYWLAQIVTTAICLFWNYAWNRLWVFRDAGRQSTP